jgi:hypothetical protein
MEALKKKRECNAKAHKVVETLLDPYDDPAELLILVSAPQWFFVVKLYI